MRIKEAAELTGVTVRTLQYYDKIGLLAPEHITEAGYRMYGEKELARLQQILFLRELEFPLSEIKELLASKDYDEHAMMRKQKSLLEQKRDRLNGIIELINRRLEGESAMSFKEFDESQIEKQKQNYAKEVKARYGNTEAYKESVKKTASYDKQKWSEVMGEADKIMEEFAQCIGMDPSSEAAQDLVKKWQSYITRTYYTCTNEILAGLGQMYVMDERFQKNIDKHGEGTAAFMSKAIASYVAEKK